MSGSSTPKDAKTIHDDQLLENELLRVEGVGKTFGGAKALENVSLQLGVGRSLGIVGENGAGKSTLMKILSGVYPGGTYDGSFLLRGREVNFRSVSEARAAGVVLIPQELHIATSLSIAENMFAGALPSSFGFVDIQGLRSRAREWLSFFGLEVDPALPASVLSPSEQRLILIAGALSQKARLLILDEPTASLSDAEAQLLFSHVAKLRNQGIGVLLISHRLDDIAQVCDEVLVLRNGKQVAYFPHKNPPRKEIVAAMIGRSSPEAGTLRARVPGRPVLAITKLVVAEADDPTRLRVDGLALTVRSGEIVGLFGLVGSGRTEALSAIFGTWRGRVEADIQLDGETYKPTTARRAIRRGLGFLTEDRKQTGIFAGHSILVNIDAASPERVSTKGIIDPARDLLRTLGLMKVLDVRARSSAQNIETLSGGNQQKVLLARWLATEPVALMLDEPTAGVDVGAREEIYRRIEDLAASGCAVLLVSSDMDEVVRLADRTHVMYKGKIRASFDKNPTRHDLMAAATGGIQ